MMKTLKIILGVTIGMSAWGAFAENLGQKAATFAIDRDGREALKDAARAKAHSGELGQFWRSYRNQTVDAIKHPASLNVKTNYQPRSELRNLRFVMPQDIYTEKGLVVVKRGTVVEPLKIQPLLVGLVFIDGRDQDQVDYAMRRGRKEPLKIVLTAGSPYDLRVKYKNTPWWGGKTVPFYFDQRKMIINTLNRLYGIDVNSVPVTLTQHGQQLLVEYGLDKNQ